MTDFIVEAITGADVGKYLATLIISMIPVIELRGAIPIGVSLGLSHAEAMGISIIGNMLPVPFIILFIRPIFRWPASPRSWRPRPRASGTRYTAISSSP